MASEPYQTEPSSANQAEANAHQQAVNANLERLQYVINMFFEQLERAFPARFKSAWRSQDEIDSSKRIYMDQFKDYHADFVAEACQKAIARSTKFMPDLSDVHEALQQILDKFFNLPTLAQAYYQACQKAGSPESDTPDSYFHPAVWFSAKEMGQWNLLHLDVKNGMEMFRLIYEANRMKVMQGVDLMAEASRRLVHSPMNAAEKAEAYQRGLQENYQRSQSDFLSERERKALATDNRFQALRRMTDVSS